MKSKKIDMVKCVIGITLFLIFCDQIIKVIIAHKYFDVYYEIWKGVLEFKPIHNIRQSWYGALGVPFMGNRGFIIVLRICIFWIGLRTYNYWLTVLNIRGKLVHINATLFFSGVICSLIDSIYWKGSIDYIRILDQITFDLKDCYNKEVIILMITNSLIYRRKNSNKEFIELGKHIIMLKRKN